MLIHSLRTATLAILIASPVLAQSTSTPFPLDFSGIDQAANSIVMTPNARAIHDLQFETSVLMTSMPTPSGALIDLELTRISLENLRLGFQVNGEPRPDLLDGLGLSVWQGTVLGASQSEVLLSFSHHGCRGWVSQDGTMTHLMPRPDANGDWSRSEALIVAEEELLARGNSLPPFCKADEVSKGIAPAPRAPLAPPISGAPGGGACTGWECPIALETDYQLYQVFGSLSAETTYVTTLIAAGSARYQEQINTTLTYPYIQFYTNSNDPWSSQDSGGSCVDVLYELQSAWASNVPTGAVLGMLMSGASLGCGVAWLGVLCDTNYCFSVTGNINGNVNFPVQQQPNNWDFIVFTHELGHNFNALHTHDYCPPLECAPSGYFGACQNRQTCTSSGTLMSYCHLCSGGTANVTTYFHPTVISDMQAHASNCLDNGVPITVDAPTLAAPATPITITAHITGAPVGGTYPEVHYGYSGGFGSAVAMTDQGSGTWTADLPGATCADQPQFYVSYVDVGCGAITVPANAPTEFFSVAIGTVTQLVSDDLESNSGWTAGDPSDTATTGQWIRVNPIGTAAQPGDDHTTGGTMCFVTGQGSNNGSLGENDVDGGTTTLYTPIYDLSTSADPLVSYWRWYSNDTSASPNADTFIVQASNNGGSTWSDVEIVGPSGAGTSGGWIQHQFNLNTILAPTSTVQLRFMASDLGAGSIIEAAIDDFEIQDLSCGTSGVGTNYCQTGPNGAVISASGSASVSANDLTLYGDNIPNNTFGLFYFGNGTANAPLGNGFRCVTVNAATTRLGPPLNSGSSGTFTRVVDLPAPMPDGSVITPGSTWYFQAWFRDGSSSDLTDGLQIDFTP
jgi:hypothetical protein